MQLTKVILILFLFLSTNMTLSAQGRYFDAKCGEIAENTFSKTGEKHYYRISLAAGDNLKITSSSKHGEYLKYNIMFYDPNDNNLKNAYGQSSFQWESGIVPASGTYKVETSANVSMGDYYVQFDCEKSSGEVVTVENRVDPNKNKIIEEKAQFNSIPLGTPIGGEIIPGTNTFRGFKTKINANTQATLKLSILSGNTPIEIQVYDPVNKSVVFFSSLGNANSLQSTINFPRSVEYIFTIKEATQQGAGKEKTEFEVQIK